MCNSGVGLTPVIDGRVHHFSAGGLYNGLVLLIDDESLTYWDHITGEAVYGPLAGRRLEVWPVRYTTVAAALGRDPGLTVSRRPLAGGKDAAIRLIKRRVLASRGFLPPPFRGTMAAVDSRLPEMAQGLGVVVGDRSRFYPLAAIGAGRVESWDGRQLRIANDPTAGIPEATWDDGTRPMQLLSRWYGFALTYPGCEVAGAEDQSADEPATSPASPGL